MTEEFNQLDPVERSLLDLKKAEAANVFARTNVDSDVVLRADVSATRTSSRVWKFRWVSAVAAAAALAFGVWGWMFSVKIDEIRRLRSVAYHATENSDSDDCNGNFLKCLTGPTELLTSSCLKHDYDEDGDVDMADFRNHQLSCLGFISPPVKVRTQ